ncbi:hypothetical protein Hanom_Chr03g00214211 [Helianthus anomalus]
MILQVNEKIPEAKATAATEETTDPAMKKSSTESSSADTPSGTAPAIPSMPGAGFPGNPFDFSSMAGLLNVLYSFFLPMIICTHKSVYLPA